MMRGRQWKQGAAWILTAAMVFSNSSFAAIAEEMPAASAKEQETVLTGMAQEQETAQAGETEGPAKEQETTAETEAAETETANVTEESETETAEMTEETETETAEATEKPEEETESEETPAETEKTTEEATEPVSDEGNTEPEVSGQGEDILISGEQDMIFSEMPAGEMSVTDISNETLNDGGVREIQSVHMESQWGDENGWTWVYTGQEQTFILDENALTEIGNCEIEWSCISHETQEASAAVEIVKSDDGHRAAVKGLNGYEGKNFSLIAEVKKDGEVIAGAEREFDVRSPRYDYQFQYQDGISQLPGWWTGLDKWFNCYVEDAEHPHGENVDVEITNVEVENSEEETSAEAVVNLIPWEDGNGWNLHSEKYGHAVVTFTYNCLDGTSDEHRFDIWVNGDVYNIELFSESGTDQMLPGASLDLTASVWLECYNEENGHFPGDVSDTFVKWDVTEGADFISILEDEADNKRLHVTANADAAGRSAKIEACVMRPNEAGGVDEVASTDMQFYINEGYHNLMFTDAENVQNLQPGQEAVLTPKLVFVDAENPDGTEITENVRYRLEWDDGQVEIRDADGKVLNHENTDGDYGTAPFTVKRLTNEGFHFQVIAELPNEEGDYQECSRQSVHSDGQNYDIWFEELRGGDYGWVYTDEEAAVSLNMENLADTNAEIIWSVGRWNEETQELDKFSEDGGYYAANGGNITLYGAKLAEICNPEDETRDFHMEAKAYLNGIEVASTGTGMHVREAFYDYDYPCSEPGEDILMPGWSMHIDSWMGCQTENSEYPHGAWVDTQVTDFEIVSQGIYDEEGNELPQDGIVHFEADENGWEIYADDYGFADLKITYNSLQNPGETETFTFRIWVNGDRFSLDPQYPNKIDCMFPGEEMIIGTDLFYEWNHGDGEQGGESVDDYEVCIRQDENGNPSYDTNLVDVEIVPNDTGKLHNVKVTAKEEFGGTDIWVYAWHNNEEVCHQRLHVQITEGYVIVEPLELFSGDRPVNPQLGEELDINAYQPRIMEYTIGTEDAVELTGEDYRFCLEYDENAWDVKAGTENEPVPTLVRRTNWHTDINLIAEQRERDEEGNPLQDENGQEIWNEIGRQTYQMEPLEFWTDFEYSYGGREQSFVFTGSPLTLNLVSGEDSPLTLPEGYTIGWEVCQYDENGQTELTALTYEEADGGNSIRLTANDNSEWTDVVVRAFVYYGDCEISGTETVVTVREPSYEYHFPYEGTNGNVTFCGQTIFIPRQMDYEAATAEYPDGVRGVTDISGIEMISQGQWNENGEEVDAEGIIAIEEVPDEGWNLRGLEYGFADLRLSYRSADPAKEGQTETEEFRVFVSENVYWVQWEYPGDQDMMLQNSEMLIGTKLFRGYLDENNEYREEELTNYRLEIQLDDQGSPAYDTELISVAVENETTLKVQSNDRTGGTGIGATVWAENAPGQEEEVFGDWIQVNVSEVYSNIEPYVLEKDGKPYQPLLAQELDLNEIPFRTMTCAWDENGEETKTEETDIIYEIEYDENAWEIKAGTEDKQFPILVRSKRWNTSVTVIAKKQFEDGNSEEIARRDYWFDEVPFYSADFIYSYGERMDEPQEGELVRSIVLTDIPLVLTVDGSEFADLPDYEVNWTFWQYDEETDGQKEMTAATAEIAGDGKSVSLLGNEAERNQWIDVQAEIQYRGEIIASTWTHAKVVTCVHMWAPDGSPAGCLQTFICNDCGAGKREYVHDMTQHAAKAATCTAQGNIRYWSCKNCKKKFNDEKGMQEITDSQALIPALGHKMTAHAAKAATCTAAGNVAYYSCSQCRKNYSDRNGTKVLTSTVTAALGHSFGAWRTTTAATVFAPARQTRTCTRCRMNEVRNYGSKLRPTIRTTANSLTMKMKQSTTRFSASGFARGDSLASVVSSNTKIVKVSGVRSNGTFKLTAQKKSGSAKLTLKTRAGAVKTVTVKVQKGTVRTTAIGGVARTASIQKGRTFTLRPVIAPITSQEKVKYKTSNKKIATVSSKGVVRGVKPGKAKITVQSGKKKVTCTVTVLGIRNTKLTNVKTSVTIRKKKSYTLKPRRYPSNSTDEIKYTTSNKSVATVSSKGKIVGKKAGKATITVKCGSAVVKCVVTVK